METLLCARSIDIWIELHHRASCSPNVSKLDKSWKQQSVNTSAPTICWRSSTCWTGGSNMSNIPNPTTCFTTVPYTTSGKQTLFCFQSVAKKQDGRGSNTLSIAWCIHEWNLSMADTNEMMRSCEPNGSSWYPSCLALKQDNGPQKPFEDWTSSLLAQQITQQHLPHNFDKCSLIKNIDIP